ncbi:MAG: hypothetical protein R2856_21470 [Caldilineaceae bacterium]
MSPEKRRRQLIQQIAQLDDQQALGNLDEDAWQEQLRRAQTRTVCPQPAGREMSKETAMTATAPENGATRPRSRPLHRTGGPCRRLLSR